MSSRSFDKYGGVNPSIETHCDTLPPYSHRPPPIHGASDFQVRSFGTIVAIPRCLGGFCFVFFDWISFSDKRCQQLQWSCFFFIVLWEKSWVSSHLFTFYFLFPSKEFLVFLKQSLAVALHAFLRFFKVCFWTSAALPLIFHSWYLTILRGMCLFVPPLNADVWIIQTFKKGTYGYCQSVIMGTLRISQYGVQCVLKKDEGTGQMMQ